MRNLLVLALCLTATILVSADQPLESADHRISRSADPGQGSVSVEVKKPVNTDDDRATFNIDYKQQLYKGKHGSVSVTGGAQKNPGQRPQGQIGLQGKWKFRRSANPEPQGSISIGAQKPLNGPDRRPTFNVDYQHQIWKGKHGSVSASGGAFKAPGQKVQGQVGIQGTWRFKG